MIITGTRVPPHPSFPFAAPDGVSSARYATLPNIMKAKKKPLDVVKPDALGVDVAPRLTTLKVVEPPKRKGGGKVADAKELVAKLRNEAKVIS